MWCGTLPIACGWEDSSIEGQMLPLNALYQILAFDRSFLAAAAVFAATPWVMTSESRPSWREVALHAYSRVGLKSSHVTAARSNHMGEI